MGITTVVSATSVFPKVEQKGKGHGGYSSFMSIFNLKKLFCCVDVNMHVLEARWRKGCGDSGNLSQTVQLW